MWLVTLQTIQINGCKIIVTQCDHARMICVELSQFIKNVANDACWTLNLLWSFSIERHPFSYIFHTNTHIERNTCIHTLCAIKDETHFSGTELRMKSKSCSFNLAHVQRKRKKSLWFSTHSQLHYLLSLSQSLLSRWLLSLSHAFNKTSKSLDNAPSDEKFVKFNLMKILSPNFLKKWEKKQFSPTFFSLFHTAWVDVVWWEKASLYTTLLCKLEHRTRWLV